MISDSVKRLSTLGGPAALTMSPAIVLAGHHPAHRAVQPSGGSGQTLLFILIIAGLVGFFWWMTRKR